MKNSSSGFGRFMAGRGFYAALAVCLVGAAAAAWITVDRSISSASERNSSVPVEQASRDEYKPGSAFDAADAAVPKRDAPVEQSGSESSFAETFNFIKKEQKFTMPTEGNILRGHSGGELVKYDSLNEWRTHDGIDVQADEGAAVKTAAGGTVQSVNDDELMGTTVVIQHDGGYTTRYSSLQKDVPVQQGQQVAAGEVIGYVGSTSAAESRMGSHLHFSVSRDGAVIDPHDYVSGNE